MVMLGVLVIADLTQGRETGAISDDFCSGRVWSHPVSQVSWLSPSLFAHVFGCLGLRSRDVSEGIKIRTLSPDRPESIQFLKS